MVLNPLVTIITPSFNQGDFIERTIQSILAQDYPNIQHIVIDGGSRDQTLDILKKYENHLRWISEKDSGQSEAINKGFRMANGEILTWINSDDVLLPGAVSKAVQYLNAHLHVMMIYGEGYIVDENDTIKQRFPYTEPKFDLTKLIYQGDYILQQSTFYRREIFQELRMLEENLHYGLDWDLFIRIGKRYPVHYVPEYFGCIREHRAAKTAIGGKKRFRELSRLVRKHGLLRYPPAYFNYAWDAYGKPLFPDTKGGPSSDMDRSSVLDLMKRLGLRMAGVLGWQHLRSWHADGWVERKAIIVLPNHHRVPNNHHLIVRGETQRPNVPIKIKMTVNRKFNASITVGHEGTFEASLSLPSVLQGDDAFHVEIESNRSYVPTDYGAKGDNRDLAFLLRSIEIV